MTDVRYQETVNEVTRGLPVRSGHMTRIRDEISVEIIPTCGGSIFHVRFRIDDPELTAVNSLLRQIEARLTSSRQVANLRPFNRSKPI